MELDLDGLTEKLGGMAGKYGVGKPAGMSDEVYKIYAERLGLEAVNLQRIGNEAEKKITNPAAQQSWTKMETLMKTDARIAGAVADMYKKDPAKYAKVVKDLAMNMDKDPAFAQKFVDRLGKNADTAPVILGAYQSAYEGHSVPRYMALVKGEKPAAPAAATSVPYAATAPAAAATGKGKGKQAAAAAAAPATTAPQAAQTAPSDPVDAFLAAPQNKEFAALVDKNNLRGKMKEAAGEDPDRLHSLHSPGQMAAYMQILQDKNKKPDDIQTAFMDAFAPKPSEMGIGGLLGQGFGGMDELKDILDAIGLGGGTGDKLLSQVTDLLKRFNAAIQGDGSKFAKYAAKNPNIMGDDSYLSEVTRANTANLHSADPHIRRESERYLKQFADQTPENKDLVSRLLKGNHDVGISHVTFENRPNKDGKMDRVAVLHETTLGAMMAQAEQDHAKEQEPAKRMAEARAKAEAEAAEAIRRAQQSAETTEKMRQGEKVATPNEPSLIPSGATATT